MMDFIEEKSFNEKNLIFYTCITVFILLATGNTLIIILGVGHNAKAHALGYLPMLLGGIILVFRKKYIWGFILSAIAMALEIGANHYQMTYYFMLLVLILGAVYLIEAIREKTLKHFFISVGILVIAVVLGIAANATGLMATKEYADWSTRGKSELTINADGSTKENLTGLDREYITRYSYGISESLDLFVPRLFGGSNGEDLGENSKTYDFLIDQGVSRRQALSFSSGLPLYWGDQPIVAGPAYIGAIIIFLFVLGLFLVKGKTKWWLLGGVIMSLLLSWGKNFPLLTNLMIDYFPLYNKFRAVSSIQVILELCAPILAVLGLLQLFINELTIEEKLKGLKFSTIAVLALGLLLLIVKGTFDFVGPSDDFLIKNYGDELVSLIQADRRSVYNSDLFRSMILVFLAALVLWFFIKNKLKANVAIILVGVLILVDLVGIGRRYVDSEDFVSKRKMNEPFEESPLDQEIKKDTGIFRVYNPSEGINGARTSYFHQSIGGYHAAKPAALEDLFSFHIYKGNINVLNMLNVKYVFQQDEEGRSFPALNPDANGNAWFISKLSKVPDADEEITGLENLDTKKEALIRESNASLLNRFEYQVDSTATIDLVDYQPNHLVYKSSNPNVGVAVFSEMYYPNGWNAYVDGQLTEHFKVNYALRAMRVSEGDHTIEFKFEPKVVETGSKITLASSVILLLSVIGGIGFSFYSSRKRKDEEKSS